MLFAADILNGNQPEILQRISAEDYNLFLQSVQIMGSQNLAFALNNELTDAELALVRCVAVFHSEHGGEYITVAQAASELGISAPAVSRTLKGLQSKGYIERKTDEADRRSVRIIATESGIEALKSCMKRRSEIVERVLANFTDEELHTIIKLHCKFTSLMSEEISKHTDKTYKRKETTE